MESFIYSQEQIILSNYLKNISDTTQDKINDTVKFVLSESRLYFTFLDLSSAYNACHVVQPL